MSDLDKILQEQCVLLEQGIPLEQVLAGLPVEATELAPLLTLAAATRSAKHPEMAPQVVQTQHARVKATTPWISNANRPAAWAMGRSPQMLAGSLALVLLVIFTVVGVSLALTGSAAAQANLADMNGMVEVTAAGSNDWHFVTAGETIRQGQRIHTYADSGVTLIFQDGSRTRVGADAELTLTTLNSTGQGILQARIAQDAGETAYNIVPLRSGGYFEVSTPAGLVNVHGTVFNVAVNPSGEVLFAVTSGKVQVSQAGSDLFLLSGQAAAVLPGQSLTEPGYQFNLLGALTRIQGDQWTVAGVTVTVTPQTDILGTYQPGDWLSVRGRVLAGGQWVADRIEPARKEDAKLRFTGIIEKKGSVPGAWQISGKTVQVNAETELSANLNVGTAVEVSFTLLPDGSWLAKEIDSLEEEREKLTATPQTRTPRATVTASATPTLTVPVTPTVTGTRTSPTPTVTGTLPTPTVTFTPTATVIPKNDTARCDNRDQQQPEGLRLAQRYQVTYTEIMTWFCKGFGFGEIDLAYGLALDTGKPVSAIFAMRSSGLGWGQIKQNLSSQMTPNPAGRGNGNGKPPAKTPNPKNK